MTNGSGMPEAVDTRNREQARMAGGAAIHDWRHDLLEMFIRNQQRAALALPFVALMFALASLGWTTAWHMGAWLAIVLLAQAVQLMVFHLYEKDGRDTMEAGDWVRVISAAEFLFAAAWSLPLFFFWQGGGGLQHVFVIAVLMMVAAVRIMIAANFMPVVLAGSAVITFNIALRCLAEGEMLYLAMGAIAVAVEVFFVQLARVLQGTARDMLIFRADRERLIDELREERDRAEQARLRAEEASRAKSRFLATMSHELRTPLNAIMGFSEMISGEMLGPVSVPQYREYAADIHSSGSYLLSLIDDILDISRIEAGRRELREEAVHMADEARGCLHLIEVRAGEKNQKLTLDVEENLPPMLADVRAIRQMWLNLASNAVKFTPEGGNIALALRRSENGGIVLSVSDSGDGISEEELKTILQPFGRGAAAAEKAIDGAGLGLPIVNALARLHDARMDISSRKGKGTTISITFPPKRVLHDGQARLLHDEQKSPTQRKLIALTA